jgi:hypothetical protein
VRNLSLVIITTKHLASRARDTLSVLPGLSGLPLSGLASNSDFIIELVNLLKRESLGFVDEEVDKGNAQETAAEPDEEDLGLEVGLSGAVVDEVGSRVSFTMLVTAT